MLGLLLWMNFKMTFDEFCKSIINTILVECPGRSTTYIERLIDNNIVIVTQDYFNGTSITNAAKNILFSELDKSISRSIRHTQ